MTKKMAALVVFVMVASLSAAGCIINPSSHSTIRLTPTKQLSLSADNVTPAVNQSFTVSGTLTVANGTAYGTAVPNEQITLQSSSNQSSATLGAVTTTANGSYSLTISIPSQGNYALQANFNGDSSYASSHAYLPITVGYPQLAAGTSRFTPTKWAGFSLDGINEQLTPDMLAYMEANHWGLWIEGPHLWSGASDYSGNNDVNASLAAYQAQTEALFTNIQNNYHIPIMINLGEISGRWSWGDTQAHTNAHSAAWYEANFGPLLNYTETWANGTRGDCFTTYWYEGGWPTFASWLRNSTTLQIQWALSGWENYIGSTCGHDKLAAPYGWITGGYGMTPVPIAQRFAEVNAVDLEIWWTSDVPTVLDGIRYIKTCYPNMPIGIDSQAQGGFNINLWGSAAGLSDHPTNYSEQRADYRLHIGQLKTALGKPFDILIAEFAGDRGNLPNQAGWTEFQIIQDQLQYELNSGWIV